MLSPDPSLPGGVGRDTGRPERTASCRRFSGPRTPSLGPEEATGKLWEKVCQLCSRRGEAPRRGRAGDWRHGRGGPQPGPGTREPAGCPREGARAGRRRALASPSRPGAPVARHPEMAQAPGTQAAAMRSNTRSTRIGNLALNCQVIFLFTSPGSSFPPDSSSFTPFPSFCFLYLSFPLCIFDFWVIDFTSPPSIPPFAVIFFLPRLDHFSVHFSQLCSSLPLIHVSFFPFLTLRLSPSSSFLRSFFSFPVLSFILIYFLRRFLGLSLRSSACISLLFLSAFVLHWICLAGGAPSSSILGDEYNVALLDAEARAG